MPVRTGDTSGILSTYADGMRSLAVVLAMNRFNRVRPGRARGGARRLAPAAPQASTKRAADGLSRAVRHSIGQMISVRYSDASCTSKGSLR